MTVAVAKKPGVPGVSALRQSLNGNGNDSATRNHRRVIYGFVIVLGAYLVARYTRFLMLFGVDVLGMAGGISTSPEWPIMLIAAFLAIGVFAARAQLMDRILIGVQDSRTLATTMSIAAIATVVVLGVGKLTYSIYSDEWRDFRIANMVSEHGLDLYLENADLEEVEPTDLKWLEWAQQMHPPGQYVPAALLPGDTYSLMFYRFLFMAPLLAFFGGTLWLARRSGYALRLYAVMMVLLLGLTYLRNYSFVRFGNELIPFITFNCVLITVYRAYTREVRLGAATIGLIFLFYAMGLFTKATMLVPMLALIGTLFLGALIMRDGRLARLAAVCIGVLCGTLGLYVLAFQGTHMFAEQSIAYGDAFEFLSSYVRPDAPVNDHTVSVQLAHTRGYLLTMPFQYGPLCVMAFFYTAWCFATRRIAFTKLDFLLLVFVGTGIFGIGFMTFLRTQYTAALMLPLMFLFARVIIKTIPPPLLMRLLLVAGTFALWEVLFYGAP